MTIVSRNHAKIYNFWGLKLTIYTIFVEKSFTIHSMKACRDTANVNSRNADEIGAPSTQIIC